MKLLMKAKVAKKTQTRVVTAIHGKPGGKEQYTHFHVPRTHSASHASRKVRSHLKKKRHVVHNHKAGTWYPLIGNDKIKKVKL